MEKDKRNDDLLQLFEESQGQFVSGERISRKLGISRTAVWKRIKKLEADGYVFESIPRLGYRLIGKPERLNLHRLRRMLAGTMFGERIQLHEEVASTQDVALEALLSGSPEGTLVLAETQTKGRGRFGRAWHSPPGKGIYMSFLLQPGVPLFQASQMTLLLSVALCRAVRKTAKANATIKWPNDILVDGKKVSGILVETIAEADRVKAMIAGIGIDVNFSAEDFPPELRESATSLYLAVGERTDREELIAEFFAQFTKLYQVYQEEGFAPIRNLWIALSSTLHAPVTVTTPQRVISGIAEGISEDGALYVRDDQGSVHTLYSGDLTISPRL